MITHVVLFRPKPALGSEERMVLVDALTAALERIPSIRRARVGRRILTGRPYEQMMSVNYTHAAIVEFDDRVEFEEYLGHQAHRDLAARFFESFEVALFYDFETDEDPATLL